MLTYVSPTGLLHLPLVSNAVYRQQRRSLTNLRIVRILVGNLPIREMRH